MADEDWFAANAPPQEPEKDWFAQNAPQVSVQEQQKTPNPEERFQQITGGIKSSAYEAAKGLIPTSTEQVAELATPLVGGVKHIIETGQKLSHIAFGGKTFAEEFPQGKTYPEFTAADYGKLIGQVGIGAAQAFLIHKGLTAEPKPRTTLAEVAEPLIGKAPEAAPVEAEVAATEPVAQPNQFTTTVQATADQAERNLTGQFDELQQQGADIQSRIDAQRMAQSSAPIPEEQVAANREIAPQTEPPSAIEPAPEPFPSISQSAETQRLAELQTEQPTPVRQALSLDELRLMRERNDLNLQNDIAKRVTGATHPAVDERLGQIDDELTTIANRELQTEGGGEISATEERQIPESSQPEYTGDDQGGTPAQPSDSGVVEPSTQVGSETPQAVTPPETVAEPAAAVPIETRVESGQFGQKGYTAVDTPAEAKAITDGEKTGIAARYREDELGADSVIPGIGKTPNQARAYGIDYIKKGGDPYAAVRRAEAGNTSWRDVGVFRAEFERLGNEKRAAESALEDNPNDPQARMAFDNADLAQKKWSKDGQPIMTSAGDALRSGMRSYPRDITTMSDITDIINDHYKGEVDLAPEKRAELQKMLRVIKKGDLRATETRASIVDESVKKAVGKVMPFDELKNSLQNKMTKLMEDCVL